MTPDGTLGGYQEVHRRPPAFGARDGRAYSVDTFVDSEPNADGRYGAALVFIAWEARESASPQGHLETDYLAFGPSPEAAVAPLLTRTLPEIRRTWTVVSTTRDQTVRLKRD